jgi:hypothetical protein
MDKIDKIHENLYALLKVDSPATQINIIRDIRKLLSGCVDNSQIIVAYDRSQLDDAIGKKSTDGMWELCQELIHNNDGAWGAMSDNCAEAEGDIQNLLDEEEMNNA